MGSIPALAPSGVVSVEAWTIALRLRQPVVFGAIRYESRDYTVLRLTDDDGNTGAAWGLTRGAPLTSTVAALAPLAIGVSTDLNEALWQRLYQSTIPYGQRGIGMRALSLIDIALWDLRARRLGLPLWRLLGGARESMPASVGGAYYRERREPDEIADELRGYVEAGYLHLKVPGGGATVAEEARWIELIRDTIGPAPELAVDAHWSWSDVQSAAAVLRTWEPARLAWVEDPLWPEAVAAHASLRRMTSIPLAIGDEQSGRWAYQNMLLAEAADIWRVDVTTVGGFTEARRIAALASTWGIPISTHVYPELHVHLGASDASVVAVEYTDPAADIDLCHRFLSPVVSPRQGVIHAPSDPGLGTEVDWELVSREAVESIRLPSAEG